MTANTDTTIVTLATANTLAISIANIVNPAMAQALTAPFADFASAIIALDPVDCNSACYTLICSCTSGSWNIAKTGVRNALKKRGYVFSSAGPDWRKRDDRKVTFTLVTDEQAKAAKKLADEKTEKEAEDFRAIEADRKAMIELERDRETTEDTIASTAISECVRLNLSATGVAQRIAETEGYSIISYSDYDKLTSELETLKLELELLKASQVEPAKPAKPARAKPAKA